MAVDRTIFIMLNRITSQYRVYLTTVPIMNVGVTDSFRPQGLPDTYNRFFDDVETAFIDNLMRMDIRQFTVKRKRLVVDCATTRVMTSIDPVIIRNLIGKLGWNKWQTRLRYVMFSDIPNLSRYEQELIVTAL